MAAATANKANNRQKARRSAHYSAYASQNRRAINKARRLVRHLRRFPQDGCAFGVLRELGVIVAKQAGVTVPERTCQSEAQRERAALGITITAMKRERRMKRAQPVDQAAA